jgi:hypothetical protein
MQFIRWDQCIGGDTFGCTFKGEVLKSPIDIPRCPEGSPVIVKVSHSLYKFDNHNGFISDLEAIAKVNHPCCVDLISWDSIPDDEKREPESP